MNTTPTSSRAWVMPPPSTLVVFCTAATTMPVAIAKIAGNIPRRMSTIHQPMASKGSAFGRTLKNCHSLRPVSLRIGVRSGFSRFGDIVSSNVFKTRKSRSDPESQHDVEDREAADIVGGGHRVGAQPQREKHRRQPAEDRVRH